MGRFLNPDNTAFKEIAKTKTYIDKTKLIELTNSFINTPKKFICSSRPRRFGKSVTAEMLTTYYSKEYDSHKYFTGFNIAQSPAYEAHINKYDVIYFDVQGCINNANEPVQTVEFISKNILAELKEKYKEFIPEKVSKVSEALININDKNGTQFIIIIDEWDALFRELPENKKIHEKYIDFLRSLFKGSEPNRFIALAYITGILPIKKYRTQSTLNNFDEYTMTLPGHFASYIGFTEEEVKNICKAYDKNFTEVKRWYDGYLLNNLQVYNPKAVIKLIENGVFQSYWSMTGTYESIIPLIEMNFDGLREDILKMLAGETVHVRTSTYQNDMYSFKNKNDVMTSLIHLGYLAYNQMEQTCYIPNEEIRNEFIDAVEETQWDEFIEFQQLSQKILVATLEHDSENVAKLIEKIHMEYTSAIEYNDENSLSSTITLAYLTTMKYYYKPKRELPAGKGFADVIYFPKPQYISKYPALVIELKWNKDTRTAIDQIKEKQYPQSIKDYTGNILLIGINYDRKSKKHTCQIEEYRKED